MDREGALESALVDRLFLPLSHTLGLLLWSCTVVLSRTAAVENTLCEQCLPAFFREPPPFASAFVRRLQVCFAWRRWRTAHGWLSRSDTTSPSPACTHIPSFRFHTHSGAGVLASLTPPSTHNPPPLLFLTSRADGALGTDKRARLSCHTETLSRHYACPAPHPG